MSSSTIRYYVAVAVPSCACAIVNCHGTVVVERLPLRLIVLSPLTVSFAMTGAAGVVRIDLRAGLGQAAERQVGGIAGAVGDGGGIEIDGGRRRAGVFCPAATV